MFRLNLSERTYIMQQVEITITQFDGGFHSFKLPRILLRDLIEGVVGNDLAERAIKDFEQLGKYEFLPETEGDDDRQPASIRLSAIDHRPGQRA